MNLSPNSEKSPDFTSSDTTENSNLSNDLKPSKRLFRFYVLIARDETNLAILISVFFLFIILILRVQLSVSYHPDISGSERSSIMPIQYLVNNLPLYVDPNEPPFYIVQYTPIYFYLVALPYKLFFDPGNVHAIYAASRLVSLLLVLVATLVFFSMLHHRLRISKNASILFACFFLGFCSYWNIYFSRVNSLLLVGTCVFVYVVALGYESSNKENTYLLLAMMIAASLFFVKQSGLVHSTVLIAHIFLLGKYRLLGRMMAVGLLIIVLGIFVSNGFDTSNLYRNVILGISNGITFDWFFYWTFDKLVFPLSTLIALAFTISFRWLAMPHKPLLHFLSIGITVFFVFALLASLKQGAAVGYFIEFVIVSLLAIALFFFKERKVSGLINSVFSGIVVLSLLHFSLLQYMRHKDYSTRNYEQLYINERAVSTYVKGILGENEFVFAQSGDNFKGYYFGHFMLNQTIAPMYDLVEIGRERGTFNFQSFAKMKSEGRLKFIITPEGEPMQPVMGDNRLNGLYDKAITMNGYDIYEFQRGGASRPQIAD
jgi:hypothetical protein